MPYKSRACNNKTKHQTGIKAIFNITHKEKQALELRIAGHTHTEIANICGLRDEKESYRVIRRALKRTLQEPAKHVRKLEIERLDRLYKVAFAQSLDPNVKLEIRLQALDRALKVSKQRSELQGLDAPKETRVGGSKNAPPIQYESVTFNVDELPLSLQEQILEHYEKKGSTDETSEVNEEYPNNEEFSNSDELPPE